MTETRRPVHLAVIVGMSASEGFIFVK